MSGFLATVEEDITENAQAQREIRRMLIKTKVY